jgi:inner membrane protein
MNTEQPTFWQRYGIFIKSILVGFLILVLLIPTAFITELVRERQDRQREVIAEVSSKWASAQTISGPFLLIPYHEKVIDDKGKVILVKRMMHYLPENETVNGLLIPEERHRSIFKIILYKSDLTISGKFLPIQLSQLGIDPADVLWNEARLCLGITDNRGIAEALSLNWNGVTAGMDPGFPSTDIASSGVSSLLNNAAALKDSAQSFELKLKLKGSERLYFTPLGKQTNVQLKSTWPDPAFDGKFLPTQSTVTGKGFTASWNILHFTRDIPQLWKEGKQDIDATAFGVELLQGIDSYGKTMRTVKYALLFIALTFFLYFFIEILKKRSVHPLQYVLVGLALCIFYTLLLSVSEYTGFNIAYLIASVATIGLITSYTYSIFKQTGIAIALLVFLSSLYGFIYILIQLQDGALLFGSIGLFILLAIVMYYSRKVDWYGGGKSLLNNDIITDNTSVS